MKHGNITYKTNIILITISIVIFHWDVMCLIRDSCWSFRFHFMVWIGLEVKTIVLPPRAEIYISFLICYFIILFLVDVPVFNCLSSLCIFFDIWYCYFILFLVDIEQFLNSLFKSSTVSHPFVYFCVLLYFLFQDHFSHNPGCRYILALF